MLTTSMPSRSAQSTAASSVVSPFTLTTQCDSLQDRLNDTILQLNSERNQLKTINAELAQELRMDQVA